MNFLKIAHDSPGQTKSAASKCACTGTLTLVVSYIKGILVSNVADANVNVSVWKHILAFQL